MSRTIAAGIARNTGVMLVQHLITMASSLALMLLLPRYLGPIQYGWMFLAGAITGIFNVFVDYGANFLVSKKVARDPDSTDQVLVDSVALRLILAVVSLVAIAVFMAVAKYPLMVTVVVLIYSTTLLWRGGIMTLYACFQGHEQMRYTSVAAVAERLFTALAIVTAIALEADVVAIVIVATIGNLIQFGVLALFLRKIVRRLPRVNWTNAFAQIREAIPYFLFMVFSTVYYRIDSLMLSKMVPEEVVGWYGASYRLFESLNFPYILAVSVYPVLSRLSTSSTSVHRQTFLKSLEVVILGGIPITVGGLLFAEPIIGLFYGLEAYGPAVVLLQVLIAGILFLYCDMILGTMLLAADRQRKQAALSLLAIPLNVILNLILIPYFQKQSGNGAIGAAVATGVTEAAIMVGMIALAPAGVFVGFRWAVLLKGTVAAGTMAFTGLWLLSAGAHWIPSAVVSVLTYILAVFVLRILEPSEIALVRNGLGSIWSRFVLRWPFTPDQSEAILAANAEMGPELVRAEAQVHGPSTQEDLDGESAQRSSAPCILFVSAPFSGIEVTFRNLRSLYGRRDDFSSEWVFIEWSPPEHIARAPIISRDWTFKAGVVARARIGRLLREGKRFDAVVFNSVVPAYLLGALRRRTPAVYCLDATPATLRADAVWHAGRSRLTEAVQEMKWKLLTVPLYRQAHRLLVWTGSVRRSLIEDYGVPKEKITMIRPGIDIEAWPRPDRTSPAREARDGAQILFVGGDFLRKGGEILLQIARMPDFAGCRFHVVTRERVSNAPPNVSLYSMTPNSDELKRLYRQADIFFLPTLADYYGLNAAMEAMASALPLVITPVGELDRYVEHGTTGFVVPTGSVGAAKDALLELVRDPGLRERMGAAARKKAEEEYDMRKNSVAILEEALLAARQR
jgi:O-antigen/teichoic acid export membrane protein/glycosyltransferase involved in cell wall biosynthesis